MGHQRDIFIVGGQSNCHTDWYTAMMSRIVALAVWQNAEMSLSYESGRSIDYWFTDTPQGRYTTDIHAGDNSATLDVRLAAIAGAGDTAAIRGLVWFQGEADAGYADLTAAWAARFAAMVEQIKTDFSLASLPCYVVGIWKASEDATRLATVRAAQSAIAVSSGGQYFDSRSCERTDGVHLTSGQRAALGNAMGWAISGLTQPVAPASSPALFGLWR